MDTASSPYAAPPLAVEEVWAGYGEMDAVRGITLHARPGAVTAIIGANGAGKTTLLRVMLGAIKPRRGRALLDGKDVAGLRPAVRAARMAYIAQRPGVAFAFSAREVVQLGCPWLGEAWSRSAAREALAKVGLLDRAEEPLGALSVGQQQRVSVARAIAQVATRPSGSASAVVLADEPVASMDPAHAIETLDLLRGMATDGASVVIVLHDLVLASRFADEVLMMNAEGTAAAVGPTRDVLTPALLERVYHTAFRGVGAGVLLPARLVAG